MTYLLIDEKTGLEVARVYIRGDKISVKRVYGFHDVIGFEVANLIRIKEDLELIQEKLKRGNKK